jgi:ribosome maturation factor RimP
LNPSEERIRSEARRLAEAVASSLGVEVVDVAFHRAGRFTRLRVDLDRPGTPGVTLEDCERMTSALGTELDASGMFEFSYTLEVSSPGIDRPIRTDDDVRRNAGRRVVVETTEPVDGTRHFVGTLLGLEDGALRLGLPGGDEVQVPRERVASARQDAGMEPSKGRPARGRERGKRVV